MISTAWLGRGSVACASELGDSGTRLVVVTNGKKQIASSSTAGGGRRGDRDDFSTPMALCVTGERLVALVSEMDTHIVFTRPLVLSCPGDAWAQVATLPAWFGPAPMVALETDGVAIGAAHQVYILGPSALRGPPAAADDKPVSIALPGGKQVCSLLSGADRPAVVLEDGGVLVLRDGNIWEEHKMGLPYPSTRVGTSTRMRYTVKFETVGVSDNGIADPALHFMDRETEIH